MKSKIATLIIVTVIAAGLFAYGCGGGSDASFSPDPTVADMPGGDNPPDDTGGTGGGDTGGGGGGSGDSSAKDSERDCFLDGFCYRTCTSATECPEGFSCIMNVCTFDCQSDDECGTGGECSDAGLCETVSGSEIPMCSEDAECGDGRFCNSDGDCEQTPVLLGCAGDVDCPLGQYCEDATHECELFPSGGVACSIDADCPGNYYCSETNSCEQECRSDYQCVDGKACNTIGKCVDVSSPARLVSFSFGALGAATDPAGPVTFSSASFKLDNVVITPAGRNQVLTSTRFRLTASSEF